MSFMCPHIYEHTQPSALCQNIISLFKRAWGPIVVTEPPESSMYAFVVVYEKKC